MTVQNSKFKQLHPDVTVHEEMDGAKIIKERDIDNISAARILRVNDIKTSYPYIVEVVRKPISEEVSYKYQDFKTQQEAERFMDRVLWENLVEKKKEK